MISSETALATSTGMAKFNPTLPELELNKETLLDHVQGTFSATASDGHINRFDGLTAVLKWINVTQAISGQLPDLSQGGMDYKSAQVQGRIDGHKVFFHEIALDAAALTMAAPAGLVLNSTSGSTWPVPSGLDASAST